MRAWEAECGALQTNPMRNMEWARRRGNPKLDGTRFTLQDGKRVKPSVG